MSRKAFYVNDIPDAEGSIRLPRDVSHHIARVLRLKGGDVIELLDGKGNCFQAEIKGFSRGCVEVDIIARIFKNTESRLDIFCVLALAKSDKVDLAIRQATELGVKKIILFPSLRSVYRLRQDDIEKKLKRWRKIAVEAMCQSGRIFYPEIIYDPEKDFLKLEGDAKIFAYEKSGNNLFSYQDMAGVKKLIIAIGPEGGWDTQEVNEFMKYNFVPVGLGPRILRYETAVVSLITLCQYGWGDMS